MHELESRHQPAGRALQPPQQIDRHWNAYIGYAHFFTGDFINQTGPSKDVDFLYASVTFTF